MFKLPFGKPKVARTVQMTLNTRLTVDRVEELFLAPLEDFLRAGKLGHIAERRHRRSRDKTEPWDSDFTVALTDATPETLARVVDVLEEAGAPLGCSWQSGDQSGEFGTLDVVLLRVSEIGPGDHAPLQSALAQVIDRFEQTLDDEACFVGISLHPGGALASFHGDDQARMIATLRSLLDVHPLPGTPTLVAHVWDTGSEAA